MTPPLHSEIVRPTTLIRMPALSQALGCELTLASELGQHTGSFKFRAAYRVAAAVPNRSVLTASSGNFGQAMAYACRLLGKTCIVVMPTTSARVKIEAVCGHGAQVELVDTQLKSRAERVRELAAEHPEAYVASAYDDPLVIDGNASLGDELSAIDFDAVIAPVGGGGLSAGILTGLRRSGSRAELWGAEPAIANDAAQSLRAGKIVINAQEPTTIADGARTVSLGRHNWEVLKDGLAGIVEVSEAQIAEALRALHQEAALRAEPTGALALAAVMSEPERFAGRRVCAVVSGGNVDPEVFEALTRA
ncbi:MAG TPA: pyridoxal-phosphate dependent enzyme [Oscillatoriaceae cyanobacterium]